MQLTEHFSFEELTITSHRGIDNTPPAPVLPHLHTLAEGLEQVRTVLGKPVIVNSGYRSPGVNAAVGGAKNSAHMSGFAADFICPQFGTPLEVAKAISASGLDYDQCIFEMGVWVHISFAPTMRRQDLSMHGGKYSPGFH